MYHLLYEKVLSGIEKRDVYEDIRGEFVGIKIDEYMFENERFRRIRGNVGFWDWKEIIRETKK